MKTQGLVKSTFDQKTTDLTPAKETSQNKLVTVATGNPISRIANHPAEMISACAKPLFHKACIRHFEEKDKPFFLSITLEWLNEHNKLEDSDFYYLNHPFENIIHKGGKILTLEVAGKPAGFVCLIPGSEGVLELGKFSITKSHRGKGLGHQLMQAAIDNAKKLGANKLFLTTCEELKAAIALYERYGFTRKPFPGAMTYELIDTYMELDLRSTEVKA